MTVLGCLGLLIRFDLDFVGMRDLHENIFKGGALLRQLTHTPVSRTREAKDFLAHVRARLDSQ